MIILYKHYKKTLVINDILIMEQIPIDIILNYRNKFEEVPENGNNKIVIQHKENAFMVHIKLIDTQIFEIIDEASGCHLNANEMEPKV